MTNVIELQGEENFNTDVLNSDKPVLVDSWAEWVWAMQTTFTNG